MSNERKRFEHRCRKLADEISRSGELPELSEDDRRCLHYFCQQKYIEGVKTSQMIGGRIVLKISVAIRLTPEGLNWLHPKADVKFMISTSIAAIELIVIIVQVLMCQ